VTNETKGPAPAGAQGTLPSENLPMLSPHTGAPPARGLSLWLVVLLVVVALVFGVVVGARLR
jgi:hypothetical protein